MYLHFCVDSALLLICCYFLDSITSLPRSRAFYHFIFSLLLCCFFQLRSRLFSLVLIPCLSTLLLLCISSSLVSPSSLPPTSPCFLCLLPRTTHSFSLSFSLSLHLLVSFCSLLLSSFCCSFFLYWFLLSSSPLSVQSSFLFSPLPSLLSFLSPLFYQLVLTYCRLRSILSLSLLLFFLSYRFSFLLFLSCHSTFLFFPSLQFILPFPSCCLW